MTTTAERAKKADNLRRLIDEGRENSRLQREKISWVLGWKKVDGSQELVDCYLRPEADEIDALIAQLEAKLATV